MDIKLLFKSLFVADFSNSVASLLRYNEPEKKLWSSQNDHSFICDKLLFIIICNYFIPVFCAGNIYFI